jgi:uncharacterized protein YodC (DUF2158 family)
MHGLRQGSVGATAYRSQRYRGSNGMEPDEKYILEILVDAAMVAERLTSSDFDERYRKDMEGGYRPEVIVAKRRYFGNPTRLGLERTMATENEFNVGDVVMLKTGGPHMTVEGIGSALDEKAVNCVWCDASKRIRKSFDAAVLEKE